MVRLHSTAPSIASVLDTSYKQRMEAVATALQPDQYTALKAVADSAAQLVSLALALAGGSIVAMISTGYLQPNAKWRYIYWLFLPAWLSVGVSVFYGHQISLRYLAAITGSPKNLPITSQAINTDFACQLRSFQIGIAFLAAWLVLYLFWWMYVQKPSASHEKHNAARRD